MTIQILQISVYGKNRERRDVKFTPSHVNIITGASKKGKSSLLDIVEYCLGSSECNVAEGFIRNTVDWYAILLQFSDTQVFIARAAPLPGLNSNSTSHMIVEADIKVPSRSELKSSTNIDSVVKFLTEKLGVPEQETEVPAGQTRSSISIDFKHSRYYLFQSQDEIAARKTLFHRQSEPHIPQAIKDTIPYFLGAAEDDRLKDLAKLRNLKKEKVRLNKKIYEIESLKGDGLQKGYLLLAEAASAGLYTDENLIPNEKELLATLSRISNWAPPLVPVEDNTDDPIPALKGCYVKLHSYQKILLLFFPAAIVTYCNKSLMIAEGHFINYASIWC
jgi:AAA15 family ATPase/GTPase